jgi:4-hydroxy-tetrahydrodipicolinate reductase
MPLRVVHFGTGHVGRRALAAIIQRPDLELVGLAVHSEEKVGKDAGDLAGVQSTGVVATAGLQSIAEIEADVCCYLPATNGRLKASIDEVALLLSSGKNVVTTSLGPLINPKTARADVFERLERACAEGGTSCFSTGTDPGWLTDVIPLALTGGSERVDSIRMTEITTYSEHMHTDQVLFDHMGFGGPVDGDPPMLSSVGIRLAWGGALSMLADALGTPLEGVIDSHEMVAAPHDFVFQGRTIRAGTTEALRFELAGIVAGTKKVVIQHVSRIRAGAAPDWPDANRPGTFRIVVEGSPRIDCELVYTGEDGDATSGGMVITAMRAVNSIPAVCQAKSGLLSVFDLPPITGARSGDTDPTR